MSLRVKVISKNKLQAFQFFDLPQQYAYEIEFTLDPAATQYDWLVVYDDLPRRADERLPLGDEPLSCPQSQTVLLTYEPSSVKYYDADYVDQFGMVLTSHGPSALPHRNRFYVPPIGCWFYGGVPQVQAQAAPPEKTGTVSVFGSAKAQKHTLHHRRATFLNEVADGLGDKVDVFGKGFRPVEHKAEGIDGYRYHLAVENHISPHHWTEKLSDAFLGYSLPLYVGCTNAADYFPEDSFIEIDIRDTQAALARIEQAIADNEYEKRLPAIIEARRRVIEEHNLGNMLARHILENPPVEAARPADRILSRHAMQRRDLPTFFRYARGKMASRRFNRKYWKEFLAE